MKERKHKLLIYLPSLEILRLILTIQIVHYVRISVRHFTSEKESALLPGTFKFKDSPFDHHRHPELVDSAATEISSRTFPTTPVPDSSLHFNLCRGPYFDHCGALAKYWHSSRRPRHKLHCGVASFPCWASSISSPLTSSQLMTLPVFFKKSSREHSRSKRLEHLSLRIWYSFLSFSFLLVKLKHPRILAAKQGFRKLIKCAMPHCKYTLNFSQKGKTKI